MLDIPSEQVKNIGAVLNDTNRPLKERFRALFTLKSIGGPVAIECISNCFTDDSALLKHELAYCLGQMQDKTAIEVLIKILEDDKQESIVRHEAAEALGAIAAPEVVKILEKYAQNQIQEIKETCQLALDRINWFESEENKRPSLNPFKSVDPAPPSLLTDVSELKTLLLDENASLFERYRAMFSLRNIHTKEAVLALAEGLKCKSALFKHEVAFVLGQIQDDACVSALSESLGNAAEHEMVRHECAEALGAIATKDCYEILNKYLADEKRVVKESCEIALDMCDYENSPEFQYANALQIA